HRSHGSTGQRQDPGKTFKGKKMAGHMGCETVTVQNLKIVRVDSELGLIAVNGSVPGKKGSYVTITDAVKLALPGAAAFPGSVIEAESDKQSTATENQEEQNN
ncbi:MAG: large ribosomal subunit protein uL3, partial [Alphaproteobacteria bacterium]